MANRALPLGSVMGWHSAVAETDTPQAEMEPRRRSKPAQIGLANGSMTAGSEHLAATVPEQR